MATLWKIPLSSVQFFCIFWFKKKKRNFNWEEKGRESKNIDYENDLSKKRNIRSRLLILNYTKVFRDRGKNRNSDRKEGQDGSQHSELFDTIISKYNIRCIPLLIHHYQSRKCVEFSYIWKREKNDKSFQGRSTQDDWNWMYANLRIPVEFREIHVYTAFC